MKRFKLNCWSLFPAMVFLMMSLNGLSQDQKENRKERKEARKAELIANFNILDSLLNAKSFVLEADFLENRLGERVHVLSTINFIKIDSTEGVLQTGSERRFGYNGVGGVTAEGKIGGWKIEKNFKSLSYLLHFNILTNIGVYDVMMNIYSDNHASAVITGLTPGRIVFDGHLATVYNSRIFKGHNTI